MLIHVYSVRQTAPPVRAAGLILDLIFRAPGHVVERSQEIDDFSNTLKLNSRTREHPASQIRLEGYTRLHLRCTDRAKAAERKVERPRRRHSAKRTGQIWARGALAETPVSCAVLPAVFSRLSDLHLVCLIAHPRSHGSQAIDAPAFLFSFQTLEKVTTPTCR